MTWVAGYLIPVLFATCAGVFVATDQYGGATTAALMSLINVIHFNGK